MKHTTTQTQQIQILLSWADEQGFSEDIFPRSIEKLLSITELNLHSKNLNFIPQEISVLQNLTKLYLSDNNLVSIPKEIGDLKNLQTLWIQNNKIQALPSEMLNLALLEELVAFDNRLQTLPKKIADMPSLKSLFLHRNCLDTEVLESEFNSIKDEFELSVYDQNSKFYHQKLLNTFTQEELDKIIECSIYSKDEGGFVNVIVVYTDKIIAEIYTDCEAKSLDVALIDNLDPEINDLPARISKDEFLEIFNTATYAPAKWVAVDL